MLNLTHLYPLSHIQDTFSWFGSSVLAVCNLGILLTMTWTSEAGLTLFKEEVAEYFPLLFVRGSLQEREGFSHQGI